MRPATSEEAASDYVKREAALDDAIAHGLYSPAQAERYRAALSNFAGYPRPIDGDPEPDDSGSVPETHVAEEAGR